MPKTLYRKYRPTRLADVVGQAQVTTALNNELKSHKIGHAYLFIGPRGTGKTSVARIFAHAVNQFDYQLEDNYLDIIEIDAASNNGVDNIRDLREKAIIAPSTGQYKVYIIDEVHMLSKSAANALLKTLEEPPAHAIFIMATTEADKIPITITSRAKLYNFKLATPEVMAQHLTTIAQQEGIKISPDALALVAQHSGGSFRDALSLLDQVSSLTNGQITAALLEKSLGLPSDTIVQSLLTAYQSGDLSNLSNQLQDALNSGLSAENIASELIRQILAHPVPNLLSLLATLPNVVAPFAEAKLLLALCTNVPKTAPASSNPPLATPTHPSAPKTTSAEPKPTAAPITTPAATPKPTQSAPVTFSWDNFLEQIHETSVGAYAQLQKCTHVVKGDTLHLYPSNKFIAKTLASPAHSKAINAAIGNLALTIHDPTERASNDPTISQISEIMGHIEEVNPNNLPF